MNTNTGYLIIGSSAAGIAAGEAIRQCDPETPITVISDEIHGPYSRCLLSYYLAGRLQKEKLWIRGKGYYRENRIRSLPGKKAVRLDAGKKIVQLEDGEEIPYRTLLLATGGEPQFPSIPGIDAAGVLGMRTLDDVEKMIGLAGEDGEAVILGGGLIGCKAAYGLRERGLKVTIAIGSNRVLSQMLDFKAAGIFRTIFEEHGITIATGLKAREIITENNAVAGVSFESGEVIPCRIVVVGKGVTPRIELTRGTTIKSDRGILVDDHMKTSVGNVYAAGDAAQAPDLLSTGKVVNSLWPVAMEQGRIAGYNMAGRNEVYPGSLGMNSLDFYGTEVIAAGKVTGLSDDYEVIVDDHSDRGVYKKLVLKDNSPVGLILVGEIDSAGVIISLIKERADVDLLKDAVLSRHFDFGRAAYVMGPDTRDDFPALKLLNTHQLFRSRNISSETN